MLRCHPMKPGWQRNMKAVYERLDNPIHRSRLDDQKTAHQDNAATNELQGRQRLVEQ